MKNTKLNVTAAETPERRDLIDKSLLLISVA